MTDNIKPCPFCGNDEIEFQTGTRDREGTPINMVCTNCGASGPVVYVDMESDQFEFIAVHEWNERVDP